MSHVRRTMQEVAQLEMYLLACMLFQTIKMCDVLLANTASCICSGHAFKREDECIGNLTKGRVRDLCSPAASQQG